MQTKMMNESLHPNNIIGKKRATKGNLNTDLQRVNIDNTNTIAHRMKNGS